MQDLLKERDDIKLTDHVNNPSEFPKEAAGEMIRTQVAGNSRSRKNEDCIVT